MKWMARLFNNLYILMFFASLDLIGVIRQQIIIPLDELSFFFLA